jgi:hypothetical protein
MFPNNWPDYITRLLRFVVCLTHVDDNSILCSKFSSLSSETFQCRKMILILLRNEKQTSKLNNQFLCSLTLICISYLIAVCSNIGSLGGKSLLKQYEHNKCRNSEINFLWNHKLPATIWGRQWSNCWIEESLWDLKSLRNLSRYVCLGYRVPPHFYQKTPPSRLRSAKSKMLFQDF